MIARYPGTCGKCRRPIVRGDNIQSHSGPSVMRWEHVRCPDNEHIIQPHQLDEARAAGVDAEHVAWLGRILLECQDDETLAWAKVAEYNEHWDGEPEPREYARRKFEATLPLARAQNILLHQAPPAPRPRGSGRNIGRREAFARYGSQCE